VIHRLQGWRSRGPRRFPVRATEITGPERDELYARQVERRPAFAEYEQRATRTIPVIALEPLQACALREHRAGRGKDAGPSPYAPSSLGVEAG
jgi:hypothetical protein